MPESLRLTDLHEADPGLRRLAHGYTTSGTWLRLLYRAAALGKEILLAAPIDIRRAFVPAVLLRVEAGRSPKPMARRIALYVHYSTSGRVSEMVRRQLAHLVVMDFAVVFITMSKTLDEDDWCAVREICALVVQRENFGRDFGAWRDLLPEIRQRWQHPDELLLVNDSVLGPIYPLAPVLNIMRDAGDGLFGLTESLQGGAHLQSYWLLARGPAVADVMLFLQRLYVSHSKWLMVQNGELKLSKWMRSRGHRVRALFGYERVIHSAIINPNERVRIASSHLKLRRLRTTAAEDAYALLQQWPLNPTQHLWHVLATEFHSPFIKTELIVNNPGHLPAIEEWPAVVPPTSPCPVSILQAHIAIRNVRLSQKTPFLPRRRI